MYDFTQEYKKLLDEHNNNKKEASDLEAYFRDVDE
jgi:hypothetical protein